MANEIQKKDDLERRLTVGFIGTLAIGSAVIVGGKITESENAALFGYGIILGDVLSTLPESIYHIYKGVRKRQK